MQAAWLPMPAMFFGSIYLGKNKESQQKQELEQKASQKLVEIGKQKRGKDCSRELKLELELRQRIRAKKLQTGQMNGVKIEKENTIERHGQKTRYEQTS